MGSTVLLLEKCSLSFLFKRHYLSKVFYFQIWHDCYVFSPQARIWVCRADWTSLFPLREEIKSTLTVVLALLNRTLKTHKSHICSENCFEVFVKDQSGRVVEPESVLLLITVLTVSVGFVPEWKQMNKCIVKFLFDVWGVVLFTLSHKGAARTHKYSTNLISHCSTLQCQEKIRKCNMNTCYSALKMH